ncbi:SFH4 [Symbiodinium natans]|uniref:SFH4 protein n=1 Tax=Symbiodinium natans TaxID=878477 RepID=A0A812NJ43_9DINO|nr:SFH4 [Symbiodinium natans]
MKTLTNWVAEFNSLVQEIGRPVLERAQGYYDTRAIWQQAIQDFASQQGELDRVNADLEAAVKNLAKAEAAFEAFLRGSDALSDQQWEELAPAKVGEENDAELDNDPKLLRMIRVSRLGDTVANLQTRRDREAAELGMKREELEEARRRFEYEDQAHSACTWNCSVKRAAPFYEKRRLHELKVDQQLTQLHSVERRLHEARKHLAEVQGAESPVSAKRRSQSRQLDELSLQSFEIAGGEPCEDEFFECDEGSSDTG